MDAQAFATDVRAAIGRCRDSVDAFLALPNDAPVPDVVLAFDRLLQPLNGLSGRVHLYTHTHPEAGLREVW